MSDFGEDPGVRDRLVRWTVERRSAWQAAVTAGDRRAIRDLYEEMGDLLARERAKGAGARAVLSLPATNRIIARIARGTHGRRVLDIGCGPTPVASLLFAAHGNHVVAMDIARSVVSLARSESGANAIHFLTADAERLPFGAGAFDLATCDDTIEHLVDPAAGLRELARVVRPGGRLVLISPNHGGIHVVVTRWRELLRGRFHPRRWYYVTDVHVIEFRWRELKRLLGTAWRLERAYPVGWDASDVGWKGRAASRLLRMGPFWRLSYSLALVLRRTGSRADPQALDGSARTPT